MFFWYQTLTKDKKEELHHGNFFSLQDEITYKCVYVCAHACMCLCVFECVFVSVHLCGILVSYYNNATMVKSSFVNLEISFVENIKTGLHISYPYMIKKALWLNILKIIYYQYVLKGSNNESCCNLRC